MGKARLLIRVLNKKAVKNTKGGGFTDFGKTMEL